MCAHVEHEGRLLPVGKGDADRRGGVDAFDYRFRRQIVAVRGDGDPHVAGRGGDPRVLAGAAEVKVVAGSRRGCAVLCGRLSYPSHSLMAGKVPHAAIAVIDAGSGG